jgi:hypothetical protein
MATADEIALTLLRQEGIDSIWELHTHAARLHRQGEQDAAEWLVKIADVAEDMFRRRVINRADLDRSDRLGRLQP